MKRRVPRWIRLGLGITAIAFTVLAVAAVAYVRSARPAVLGEATVAGPGEKVDIGRDSLGIPHIWAGDLRDLVFAQGYVHAQDRLWQMELLRRVAQGRLAEVFGRTALASDRFLRTVGIWRAVQAQELALHPESRRLLEAYAAGVNAWLARRTGALPPEFLLLRARPEPWTVAHSLAVEKVMSFDLSLISLTLDAAVAASSLGDSDRARWLLADYPEWGTTIIDAPSPTVPPLAGWLLAGMSMANASNAWVIAGSRTRSGKPILANDMHLSLRAPSLWYLAGLHAPGYEAVGMTIPGVPFVIAGHTRAIAWGFTNAMVDDADLFVERIDPLDTTRYLVPGGTEPFQRVHETIHVRGQAEPVVFEIRSTRHGPVLEDAAPGGDSTVLALRWASHDPSRTIEAFPRFGQATTWEEFVEAARLFDNPHQNIVYADTAGTIGYVLGGRVPARGVARPPMLPVPGWTGEWDWNGYLGPEAKLVVRDPPSGYIVTANNRQAAGEGAGRIGTFWETPFRAERIREMVEAAHDADAAAVQGMQLDVRDGSAARYRARAVRAARDAGDEATAAQLESWDLRATRDSHSAAMFYVWYDAAKLGVAERLYGKPGGWLTRNAFDVVLETGSLGWLGERGPAVFDSIALAAFLSARTVVGSRRWGDLHHMRAEHPLSSSRILERLFRFSVGGESAAGARTTVNVSQYGSGPFPVTSSYGASQRHVVDMADIDGAGGFIIPTGQSGLPFDRHYRDQWPRWRDGGLWRIPLDRAAAEAGAVHRMRLVPARD